MCKCTPKLRTPFCGKGDCIWPGSKPEEARALIERVTGEPRASEQARTDCIITHPRSSFDRVHNSAITELLALRASLAQAGPALEAGADDLNFHMSGFYTAKEREQRNEHAATLRHLAALVQK